MPSQSSPAFQQLFRLDVSSPEFGGQLCKILYREEYAQCVPNLKDDELVWLANYLDEVCHRTAFPRFPFKPV